MTQTTLPQHFLEFAKAHEGRKLPPVERWNPDYCGEIDMRIARDGRWFYMGTPINRLPLVKLFASILRRDGERHVLVTPVERVGITVDDSPFLAVEFEEIQGDMGPVLVFRTNLDEIVQAGEDHPLRLETGEDGGFRPLLHVRGDLWARASRPVALQLAEKLQEKDGIFFLQSAGMRFSLPGMAGDASA